MFAANAELEVAPRRAAPLDGDGYEFADTVYIDRDEWITLEDAEAMIVFQETRRIIP